MKPSYFNRGLYPAIFLTVFLMVISFAGCVTAPAKPSSGEPVQEQTVTGKIPNVSPEKYRDQAAAYEKNGELLKALHLWEALSSVNSGNRDLREKITALNTQVHELAGRHFKKGLAYYNENSVNAARKEFLLALAYNPRHEEALDYVKNRLGGDDYMLYEVKAGDTLYGIAKRIYNDHTKDIIISRFNDLDKDGKFIAGAIIKLPVIEPLITKQAADTEDIVHYTDDPHGKFPSNGDELLKKANSLFKAKKYQESASAAEKVLEYDPKNKVARELLNASYYQLGKTMSSYKNYTEAIKFFNRVDPKFKGLKAARAAAEKSLAEVHYLAGVKHFVNEELARAIKEWETTLTLNPKHIKARKDIDNARGLLQKLQQIR